jgi:LPXTG-motif cell wall-anchored protein
MKKTLSIALVAAMTLSAVGMSAFAGGVKYNGGGEGDKIEKLYAEIKIEGEEDFIKYDKNHDGKLTYGEALDYNYTDLNTPTKTFRGWVATKDSIAGAKAEITTDADKKVIDKEAVIATSGNPKATVYVAAAYTVTTDDSKIKENMEKINAGKDTSEADKLAELDKKYNADGKNAYGKDKKDVEGAVTIMRHTKKETDIGGAGENYFNHARKVAGVSEDDGVKTWVFDVQMLDGQKLYSGKNQRVCLELEGVDGGADLNKFGVTVYHIKDWCKAEKIKNVYTKGNKVYFWNDEFSPYVVSLGDGAASTGAADASNPSTGDFSAVPVALLAAAALGATGFVAYKKRKAE